jgi:hypothetical protein
LHREVEVFHGKVTIAGTVSMVVEAARAIIFAG